ncbi:MAG: ABC transporter ATP-binding protein [Desulfovibrio sp.]|jgi:NitT/TauT family transport system ATP-binding protein|nr:ABC transporter ATP-binding protein [Desulfovibrio sp.]
MNAPFLDVCNLTLQYKTAGHLVTATYDVSFQAHESERLILLGPSGCGKSTILKAIGGYISPARGKIRLRGKEVTKPGADRGMVFQEFDQLLPWKSALENIVFAICETRPVPRSQAKDEAWELLRKVNLTSFANSYPHELSGGMKQRVAIARCLGLRSEIILMDEPFASLDALTRQKMQEELLNLWADTRCTLVFVTHSIDEAIILGSRIVLLSPHPGQVVAELNGVIAHLDEEKNAELAGLRARIARILFKDQCDYTI